MTSISLTLVLIGIAYLLSIRLQALISDPILKLVEITKAVARHRNYSVRAKKNSDDELGLLTENFNDMLEQINNRDRTISESENRFRDLFNYSPISLWEIDYSNIKRHLDGLAAQGKDVKYLLKSDDALLTECAGLAVRIDVNKHSMEMFEARNKQELYDNFAKTYTPENKNSLREVLIKLYQGETRIRYEGERLTLRGKSIYVQIYTQVPPGFENSWARILFSLIDISERKQAEESRLAAAKQLHQMAYYDALTALPNRTLFQDRLETEILSMKRSKHHSILLYIDLDDFKNINDTLGHKYGDEILVALSKALTHAVRKSDSVARLGGDEFVVLLPGKSSDREASIERGIRVAEILRAIYETPIVVDGRNNYLSLSIGVCIVDEHSTVEECLKQGDTAMYKAKALGKNRISFFEESMQKEAERKLEIETELRNSIQNSNFQLYYQAQVNALQEVNRVEALIRWHHPDKGLISPLEFIPIAEDSGLIHPIGDWVLTQALKQMELWKNSESSIEEVSINISPKQFRQKNFIQRVKNHVTKAGSDCKGIIFEITEGVFLENIDEAREKIQSLKEMGIKISIDDFGTGYSSLAYLQQLPIDELKIDRSFINDIQTNNSDAVIVETIISMAHHLGLELVAEGVETLYQLNFLKDRECEYFQGYLFSKPIPVEELDEKNWAIAQKKHRF